MECTRSPFLDTSLPLWFSSPSDRLVTSFLSVSFSFSLSPKHRRRRKPSEENRLPLLYIPSPFCCSLRLQNKRMKKHLCNHFSIPFVWVAALISRSVQWNEMQSGQNNSFTLHWWRIKNIRKALQVWKLLFIEEWLACQALVMQRPK